MRISDLSSDVCSSDLIGGDAQFLPQDVANEARWAEVVGHAEQNWGRLDVLVNNAGISMFGLVTDLSYAQWRRCIEVDLDSVFLGTRAAIPLIDRKSTRLNSSH